VTGTPHYGGVPIGDFLLACSTVAESGSLGDLRIHLLGVGKTAAATHLAVALRNEPAARAVLLFGVAGAFPDRHRRSPAPARAGGLCIVGSDRFGDEGVATPQGFRPIEDVLAPQSPRRQALSRFAAAFPANPRMARQAAALLGAPIVRGVTVSTCSGTDATSQLMARRSGADVETMEGAAVAYVCRQFELPLLHIRAVSNWTGDRDRGEWNLGAAVDTLAQAMRSLLRGSG
jgi:futalosine hydrolase